MSELTKQAAGQIIKVAGHMTAIRQTQIIFNFNLKWQLESGSTCIYK